MCIYIWLHAFLLLLFFSFLFFLLWTHQHLWQSLISFSHTHTRLCTHMPVISIHTQFLVMFGSVPKASNVSWHKWVPSYEQNNFNKVFYLIWCITWSVFQWSVQQCSNKSNKQQFESTWGKWTPPLLFLFTHCLHDIDRTNWILLSLWGNQS